MTDDIKVGDRFLGRGTVLGFNGSSGCYHIRFDDCPAAFTVAVPADILWKWERLPPEIGVGDEVRHTKCPGNQIVRAVHGDVAWVGWVDSDKDIGSIFDLSDLTLVKKAEKD